VRRLAEIVFEVLGKPEPADFRIGRWGAYEKPKVKEWKAEVRRCAADAMAGRPPLAGPLRFSVCFVRPAPASYPKKPTKAKPWPWAWTSKPDWDNMCKCAQDACSKVVWNDDAQIVWGQPMKMHGDRFRIIVRVEEVWEEDLEAAYQGFEKALERSRTVAAEAG